MPADHDRLFLIDASAYVYRAFYALPELNAPDGMPTNAIYGVITMLLKLLEQHRPQLIAAVFDRPEPTFRHTAFAAYKANRRETPDSLTTQLPEIKEIVALMGIPTIEKAGVEADDIIGTLARQAARAGAAVTIISGDKDLLQLVGPDIVVMDTMQDRAYDSAAVRQKFGVTPDRLIDLFSLTGDSADNIPGVAGIGPKTAEKLLTQFDDLDAIYANLDAVTQKRAQSALRAHRDEAFLSRHLVTIDTAVELNRSWRELVRTEPATDQLRQRFKRFGFGRLLKNLDAPPQPDKDYRLVLAGDLPQLLATLERQDRIAVDLETTSEQPMEAEIVGVSLAWQEHHAVYIPLAHQHATGQADRRTALTALKPILENPCIAKIGHNIKYDYIVLKRAGITLQPIACDTMVASYVLNPSKYRHNLDEVALDVLDHHTITYKDVVGSGKNALRFDQVSPVEARDYACEDADIAFMLAARLLPQIEQQKCAALFHDIEMPLVRVLAEIEIAGVKVDTALLAQLSQEFGNQMEAIQDDIFQLAGEAFNINSPKQLGVILFEKLQLPVIKKTKTGYATDVDTLTQLAGAHQLPERVLAYRSLAKLKSTYADAVPQLRNPRTGRIHTSFNQTVTATGRLSSSEPNLQNIPIRTAEGRRIRAAFIPEAGSLLLSADYSQVELRILAHLSGDTTLRQAFLHDEDIHIRTAAEVWHTPPDQVTERMRRDAKAINFGIIYGMSAFGLAKELKIDAKTAQEYIDSYFQRYGDIRRYMDDILDKARADGYVETLMHRRRYLPDLGARNAAVRRFAERTAINTPIQGTAADLIKIAMLRVAAQLTRQCLHARIILQVHDELVLEVPEAECDRVTTLVRREMEGVIQMAVPLKVDIHTGSNWRDAH